MHKCHLFRDVATNTIRGVVDTDLQYTQESSLRLHRATTVEQTATADATRSSESRIASGISANNITSGRLSAARIPDLDASKTTLGTFSIYREGRLIEDS